MNDCLVLSRAQLGGVNIFVSVLRSGVFIYFLIQLIDQGSRTGTLAVKIDEQAN